MKISKALSIVAAGALLGAALPAAAPAQTLKDNYTADFGLAWTQATVERAQMGLAGIDIQVGKMVSNALSVGVETGFDVCSFRSVEYPGGNTVYERLGVIPVLLKARYHFNVAPLTQVYGSLAGGVYQTVPHLNTTPIGGVWDSGLHAGGAGAVGFTYYFLATQGIGFEFEYHFFDADSDELFSYFAARINYSLIKM